MNTEKKEMTTKKDERRRKKKWTYVSDFVFIVMSLLPRALARGKG